MKRTPAQSLKTYVEKRDFARTPEPSGATAPVDAADLPRFVIQKHHASRLHYDVRLEADGVLKSWAVPKGPSYDTRDKRFAVAVEDHPLEYRDFEGVIEAGNYGAGEVVVWDRGTYRLLKGDDTSAQIAKGSLKFELYGEKLRGAFALVHIKGRDGEATSWLLIKERDDRVDPDWKIDEHGESVISGRTLDDVAVDPAAPHHAAPAARSPRAKPVASKPAEFAVAKKKATEAKRSKKIVVAPEILGPMLATAVADATDDRNWYYELKWDGYRAIVTIDAAGEVAIASRNGKDFTTKFPELRSLATAFSPRPAVIDGEIVVLDDEGRPSFSSLQARLDRFGRAKSASPVTFVAFDLLAAGERDLRDEPLSVRKAELVKALTGEGPVLESKHVVGDGRALFEMARASGLEGIVMKRAASPYVSKRSKDWLKVKALRRQEFVIGGWTEGRGSRAHFGALLVGTYRGEELVYAGSVGTGFDAKLLAGIAKKLAPLAASASPFVTLPKLDAKPHFVEPVLLAEISFTEWSHDDHLRHPVFVALREDKPARDVVRET